MEPFRPEASPGARAVALVDALARHTDEPGRLTRLYLSPAHRATAEATLAMMREAGLEARIDAVGNVIGRREGRERGAPALIIGSHLDSVVDAGRFDGPLGVVAGIVAAEALVREGPLPFAIEVAAFGDEENVRFPTNLSTSYALAGRYRPEWLDARDGDGVALRDALLAFGGDPDAVAALARRREDVVGYLEVHIEQGPLLESKDLAVGIVSAIAGITRARALVTGEAGHAGTVPMAMRRDALAAAAEMIAAVEGIGARRADTVATVGAAKVAPGAVNVIAGEVAFTIDARAPDDAVRGRMVAEIDRALRAIAERRGVALAIDPFMDSPATAMDPGLAAILEDAAKALGVPAMRLASGAGHDAVAMATLCPVAMLFVRCKGGISHNPAESVDVEDVAVAIEVMGRFLEGIDAAI